MSIVRYVYYTDDRQFVQYLPDNSPSHIDPKKKARFSDPEQVARSRAFNQASRLIWLNSDLELFVTLTYKKQHQNYNMILDDLKNLFTRKNIKYLAVVEKHKSGKYHVHAITNKKLELISLRKNKFSVKKWNKGYSHVKFLGDCDSRFNVGLYILKYIQKSEKIGGRYVLKSRNLTKPELRKEYLEFPARIRNQLTNSLIYQDILKSKHVSRVYNKELGCDIMKMYQIKTKGE